MTQVNQLADLAKRLPRNGGTAWDDSGVRQKIAKFAVEAYALKYTGYRQLTRRLKGMPPGPEGSMMKLCGTELSLRMAKFAMELLGPYSQFEYKAPFALDRGKWSFRMLAARGPTIYAGTNQIQHNIIGERVLGLPKGTPTADTKLARGRRPIPTAYHQRLQRHLAPHPERTRLPYRGTEYPGTDGRAEELGANVGRMDKLARAVTMHDREARNQIVQLAHVARERIATQRLERAGRETQSGRREAQEAGGEQSDVNAALAQPALSG